MDTYIFKQVKKGDSKISQWWLTGTELKLSALSIKTELIVIKQPFLQGVSTEMGNMG